MGSTRGVEMENKIFCDDLHREINLNACYRLKGNPHCRKCPVQKPAKTHRNCPSPRRGPRSRKKELLLTSSNEMPTLFFRPPKDEITLEEFLLKEAKPGEGLGPISFDVGIKLNTFKKTKNPAYVIEAFLAAYEEGLYPPLLVLDYIAKVFSEYKRNLGKESLDKLFFRIGKGQSPSYKAMFTRQRDQMLMRDVFQLELLGFTIPEAARMVTARLVNMPGWDQTGHRLAIPKKDTIRDMYFQGWKDVMRQAFYGIDLELLFLEGEQFLKNFPEGSFPLAKENVNKVMLAFRKRSGDVRDRLVAQDMLRLELVGFTAAEAAHMVVARFNAIPGCEVKEDDIKGKYLQEWRRATYAESKKFTTQLLKDGGEKVLRRFPKDSFPPSKRNIDQVMKSFRATHSGAK